PACTAWNSMVEGVKDRVASVASRFAGYAGAGENASPVSLADVEAEEILRTPTGIEEFDRVLGGGLVTGSAILIGGDPGIGKSTLLLQTLTALSKHQRVLYVTGEESIRQVSLRAKRLQLACAGV